VLMVKPEPQAATFIGLTFYLCRPSCWGVVPWCVPMLSCTAPLRDRRRLCADHRVEPYACRCRCQRSARAPRLTFLSFSLFSLKKIIERICNEYT
jgi:hypothetical protein